MKSASDELPALPESDELFSLNVLAEALGVCHASAWGRVQEAIEAIAAGQAVAAHLRPNHWVQKGKRREVFFTADQIAAAREQRDTKGR